MFDDDLKATWARAGKGTPLSRDEIEALLRPTARRTGRGLEFLAWTHIVMLGLTALLALANLPGYRDNPTMLAVEGALGFVAAVFCILTFRLLAGLRRIARADRPLVETVEQRLAFTEQAYGPWLLMASLTPWMLSLAITTLIDNEQGHYRINHPGEFALVTAVMLGITWVSTRFSTVNAVRELRAVLHDLRGQVLDATSALVPVRRRSRAWLVLGVVLLALSVILGLLLWLGAP